VQEQPRRTGDNTWYVDSGCSRHMTGNISLLANFKPIDGGSVVFAGDKGGKITGEGTISNGKVSFENVNFCEQLKHNLLSVSQVSDKKYTTVFNDKECMILKKGFVVPEEWILLRAPRRNDTYSINMNTLKSTEEYSCLLSKASEKDSIMWHRRMGHINFRRMNYLVKHELVSGVPNQSFSMNDACISCKKGKQSKKHHPSKLVNSISAPLELLHMDLFGPISVKSIGGKSYCLVVTDDFSRFSWVFFLGTKDETTERLKFLFNKLENIVETSIKSIRSDNGTEFKNHTFQLFCLHKGINHQFSAARTPQQNGIAERKNRTLIETARTMLSDSKLPITFWAEAVNTACYVLNRVTLVKKQNKTSYHLINKRKPNLQFLEPFGCPCTIMITRERISKFGEKTHDGYFLGYSANSPNKRVFDKATRTVEECFEVECFRHTASTPGTGPASIFDYDSLFKSFNISPSIPTPLPVDDELVWLNGGKFDTHTLSQLMHQSNISAASTSAPIQDLVVNVEPPVSNSGTSVISALPVPPPGILSSESASESETEVEEEENSALNDLQSSDSSEQSEDNNVERVDGSSLDMTNLEYPLVSDVIPQQRIHTTHPTSNIIGDHSEGVHTRIQHRDANVEPPVVPIPFSILGESSNVLSDIVTPRRSNRPHSRPKHLEDFVADLCLYTSCFLSQMDPKNIKMALTDPFWVEAMQEELQQFLKLNVWEKVILPKHEKAINTKWVFRVKKDERGVVIRNKARLVVQGFYQIEGLDYDEVFAPVARLESIRLFLAYASYMQFIVYQLDIKSAFLYGKIHEDIYVNQPPGFEDHEFPNHVFKLNKALYGLHQAPRAWYETLSQHLMQNGFSRGTIDQTLFTKKVNDDLLLVQIYVDDIIFGSTNVEMCKDFEKLMKSQFEMSAMGVMTFFLGLQVQQSKYGIYIHQSKYVNDVLSRFKMLDCKVASTPVEVNHKLGPALNEVAVDEKLYRSMIGSLMYLTASRPDITFAVSLCSRFQAAPKECHLKAVKRILCYLKGRPNLGLWYPYEDDFSLIAFSDSDYGGCNADKKSTTGGCQFLGSRLVSWQCKKQATVSVSSAEAEYIAAASCCSQVLWIQHQLRDYGLILINTPIHIDNSAAVCIIRNPVQHTKTKHIDIRFHFIRDCYEKHLINLIQIETLKQNADILTKAFPKSRFEELIKMNKLQTVDLS
jgi:hypothetical protein